ncbi:MAG: mismatch repair protein [Acidobacteriota bacterium]|nr:mismatch repair protein [Acidobacteriota bacterium]
MPDPQTEYATRLEARLQAVERHESGHIRVGNSKLATLVAGLTLAWISLARHWVSSYWLVAPAALYIALAVWHERILRARTLAERAVVFYRQGIARIEDRWPGHGNPGDRFRDEKHVYAEDLDLFGRGSLFELLCTARTPMGEARLALWLLAALPVPAILERHAMVSELREKLDLREDLALVGEDLRASFNPEALAKWAESPRVLPSSFWRVAALALALLAVGTLAWGARTYDYLPLVIVLAVEALFRYALKSRVEAVITTTNSDAQGLALFAATLKRLERESFSSPRLRAFVDALNEGGTPASSAMAQLARIAYWIESHDSFMVRLLDIPLLITVQVGFAAEAWRGHSGRHVRSWIDAVGEMEALVSLAAYSYEHPRDRFPEFADPSAGPLFDGQQLGHPLIEQARCVPNSVRLDRDNRILMVSGSNMSGKSTYLRVAGVNAVLALAGAPIRGQSLRLSPLVLGTRLRTTDSLQESRSGFYTEILRIRQVFDLTSGELPVLFLFDELLEGTNSKDRRIGAEGLLRAFIERGAIGIVTTHDLALTEITHELGAAVSNAHLQDYVENGSMRFDYKLRPGVVARSNALELMRLVGLQV